MEKFETYEGDKLWEILPRFFLTKMNFIIDGRTHRSGIFQNYKTVSDQYRIKFKGDVRVMVLPTPFEILLQGNTMILDYRAETLFHGDEKLINTLKRVKKQDASVFFDKIVKVKIE